MNAVFQHQRDSALHETSGILTTPHFDRARFYALHGGRTIKGVVLVLDRKVAAASDIQEFAVKATVQQPLHPEDDEVILVAPDGASLPDGLIVDAVEVTTEPHEAAGL